MYTLCVIMLVTLLNKQYNYYRKIINKSTSCLDVNKCVNVEIVKCLFVVFFVN